MRAIPVQEIELTWNSGEATQYTTTLHGSNRKAHFSSAAFLRPDRSRELALVGGGLEWLGGQAAPGYAAPASAALTAEQSVEMGKEAADRGAEIRQGASTAGAFGGAGAAATTSLDTASARGTPEDRTGDAFERAQPAEGIGTVADTTTQGFDTGAEDALKP